MFRMFFISFIVAFSLYQPLSKLDVVVLTTLTLDLIHASGMTDLVSRMFTCCKACCITFNFRFIVSPKFLPPKDFYLGSHFLIPDRPKCNTSSSRRRKSNGIAIWSSTTVRPHPLNDFSKTSLFPPGAVSPSFFLKLGQTLNISESVAIFDINVFRSNMKSNSAFLIRSFVIFLIGQLVHYVFDLYIRASLPSVSYWLKSTIASYLLS